MLHAAGGQWQVSDQFHSPSVASICATAEGCESHQPDHRLCAITVTGNQMCIWHHRGLA